MKQNLLTLVLNIKLSAVYKLEQFDHIWYVIYATPGSQICHKTISVPIRLHTFTGYPDDFTFSLQCKITKRQAVLQFHGTTSWKILPFLYGIWCQDYKQFCFTSLRNLHYGLDHIILLDLVYKSGAYDIIKINFHSKSKPDT